MSGANAAGNMDYVAYSGRYNREKDDGNSKFRKKTAFLQYSREEKPITGLIPAAPQPIFLEEHG
jgi:hypothetical protein